MILVWLETNKGGRTAQLLTEHPLDPSGKPRRIDGLLQIREINIKDQGLPLDILMRLYPCDKPEKKE